MCYNLRSDMTHTITAIYENGIIRRLEKVELDNGETVEVILLNKTDADPTRSRQILSEIASLPIESESNGFSGEDHDQILYPKK